MRKKLAFILVPLFFFLSSFSGDPDPFFNFLDQGSKITHFYPNPATSYINFNFDKSVDKSYTFQVYSFMGKKMYETRITDAKLNIVLDDNYYRGIYVYQLHDQTGKIIESGKFQVSK